MKISTNLWGLALLWMLHLNLVKCLSKLLSKRSLFSDNSSKITVSKSTFLSCTSLCSFTLAFNDTFQRPTNCSKRVSSFKCLAQVTMEYHSRRILVNFRTNGLESDETGFDLYGVQQFLLTFNFNYTFNFISFACFFDNDCDWRYVQTIIEHFVKLDVDSLYHGLRAFLYNPNTSTGSIRCLTQNTTSDCSLGRCIASVDESQPVFNRSCAFSNDPTVGLDIRRRRTFPTPLTGTTDTFSFVCNQPLCNDDVTKNALQGIMNAYATAIQMPKPPSKNSAIAIISNLSLMSFLFISKFFM